ncbi:DNA-binding protein [Oscillatoria sp. CS-180]|uniref:PPC domain-containing DNA-binding protein n=1 Tax=Oscillatoria sp. CS-180 TaxID=3021720 RepID=UPI0023312D7E|nr:PPC domain-containing DNA-binding protein [Oscillatoria sp. CS-180]MDB9527007.1 DNA-binding protein [Oscillatoria sp. CS-180]
MTGTAFAPTALRPFVLRLSPGDDLKESLQQLVQQHRIAAGCILTTVGSLQQASLRFAGQDTATLFHDRFEIVSLVGTLSLEGLHLHMAIANAQGQTCGGHIMPGCLVYTTAEIVIGVLAGVEFQRRLDEATGYRELKISQ